MYIIRLMRGWTAGLAAAMLMAASSGCHNPMGPKYEYEEQVYLNVDGSATVIVDSSIAAFVALRGLPFDPSPSAPIDRDQTRRLFEALGCRDVSVGQPWRRDGRRFIQIRIETDDVRTLAACKPLDWSTYLFERTDQELHYRQTVGAAAAGDPGTVNWTGAELVAFKLHLPSRVTYHNVKRLDGTNGDLQRGNILTWAQYLRHRRAGVPIDMEVRMEPRSILYQTLWLFAGAFVAALAALGGAIWWTVRRGRRAAAARPSRPASSAPRGSA